jgi:hypothetical protein
METLKKQLKFRINLGISFIVSAIIGGAGLGFGLGYNIIPLWAISIAFLAAGFYGVTLTFSTLILVKEKIALVKLIDKGLVGISAISKSLGKRPKAVIRLIRECITKGYLEGYSLSADSLALEHIVKNIEVREYKCPGCGRLLNLNIDHECPYCGFKISAVESDN